MAQAKRKMNSEPKLTVYLGDVTHDTVVLVSDTIPINIGFIASYLYSKISAPLDIRLFKYPNDIFDAIDKHPPDILGLSNYSWNSHLSERVCQYAKERSTNTITVQGGTNFPQTQEEQRAFALTRPSTDIFTLGEGELSFESVTNAVLANDADVYRIFDQAIPGCGYLTKGTKSAGTADFVVGKDLGRLKTLDEIPSPYLNGLLDSFFDGELVPFIETNRGCPFKCTFCHTGHEYYNKVHQFSITRVRAEINYIAEKAGALGISNLHIADTNFGMYRRDKEICELLQKTKLEHNWPLHIMATTGKNSKKKVIEATDILGQTLSVNMSVQSMDVDVLSNINRDNISLNDYMEINQRLEESGRPTEGELIVGLPGETKETFLSGLEKIINAKVSVVCSYSLMLLHGTPFKDPEYRRKYAIKGKYRIVPLNMGIYRDQHVFDVEEIAYQTKDMSYNDYLSLRRTVFLIELLYNSKPFYEFVKFAEVFGVSAFDFIQRVDLALTTGPQAVLDNVEAFMSMTRDELWSSEDELKEFFKQDENYRKLLNGESGGNVIYKCKAIGLSRCKEQWITFLGNLALDLAEEKNSVRHERPIYVEQVEELKQFCSLKLRGLLEPTGDTEPVQDIFKYDVGSWLNSDEKTPLGDFVTAEPLLYRFWYSEEQLAARRDLFDRYGTSIDSISKIVTRVSNLDSLIRRRSAIQETIQTRYPTEVKDRFVRYRLSN